MFDTVCTIKTKSEEVFTQAIHPSEPLLTIGLASGHVESYRLPGPASSFVGSEGGSVAGEDGLAVVHKAWRTRRHVGSCRSLAYSSDGRTVFSAGSEGVLKGGDSITGKLLSKIELPLVR